jgi:hypothetical protein
LLVAHVGKSQATFQKAGDFIAGFFVRELQHTVLALQQPAQMNFHALGEHRRVVAAFQQADNSALGMHGCDIPHDLRELVKVLDLQTERADGVVTVAVEASAYEHELWTDARRELLQLTTELVEVFAARCAERNWQIPSGAQTVAGAGFVRRAGARIKRPAVNRKKADIVVCVKRVLRGIAVMDVPIDDQHSIHVVFLTRNARSDGNVVEQAKAHRPFGECMMAGRPYQAKRGLRFAFQNTVNGIARCTGRQSSHIERCRTDDGIRIQSSATLSCRRGNAFNVRGFMNKL